MNITYKEKIEDLLEAKRYDEFLLVLEEIVTELNEDKKQNLLKLIVDCYFTRQYQLKFRQAFDLLIGSYLDLNFNVNSWGASFLSLVILRAPSIPIFDYFLSKGAEINFIGDKWALKNKKPIHEEYLNDRYETCLDFIEIRLADLLLIDYDYYVPAKKVEGYWSDCENEDKEVILSKEEYLYLHEQSEYLHSLIETDKLKDHIEWIGGKTYEEIKHKKNSKTQPLIRDAEHIDRHILKVVFYDGTVKIVDFKKYLKKSKKEKIRQYLDIDKFKEFSIQCGNLSWNFRMEISAKSIYKGNFDTKPLKFKYTHKGIKYTHCLNKLSGKHFYNGLGASPRNDSNYHKYVNQICSNINFLGYDFIPRVNIGKKESALPDIVLFDNKRNPLFIIEIEETSCLGKTFGNCKRLNLYKHKTLQGVLIYDYQQKVFYSYKKDERFKIIYKSDFFNVDLSILVNEDLYANELKRSLYKKRNLSKLNTNE